MTKPCQHGVTLPRGLKCDRGYLVLTVEFQGKGVPHPGCGPHIKEAEVLATERLMKIRSEILRGKFGFEPDVPEKLFKDVVPGFLYHWENEKTPEGKLVHGAKAVYDCKRTFKAQLTPYFGNTLFHNIRTIEIENYRTKRLEEGVLGTSVNRELVPLSSMFNMVKRLIALERIKAFKQPLSNPCDQATKATLRVSKRLLSDYELKKLNMACRELNDLDALAICEMIYTSALSVKDIENLEAGDTIDIKRAKTGVPINIPVTVLLKLNFTHWRTRWLRIREKAGFCVDRSNPEYVDAKVLRKTAINNALVAGHPLKLVSQYAGHASEKTTERNYTLKQLEAMRPISEFLKKRADDLFGMGDL